MKQQTSNILLNPSKRPLSGPKTPGVDLLHNIRPLLGPADTERVILAALQDARDPNLS